MYILKVYLIHYTLRQKANAKKMSFGQNKQHKKYPLFSYTNFNSLHSYFKFGIFIWADETQGSSL